jgi:hypothetical protein
VQRETILSDGLRRSNFFNDLCFSHDTRMCPHFVFTSALQIHASNVPLSLIRQIDVPFQSPDPTSPSIIAVKKYPGQSDWR